MLNAAQLLGSGGGIFLGSRTEIFLCGAGVWNLKNVFISALCVHKITSPLMECFSTYNDVLCGFMCWSSQDGATVIWDGSLCKGHPLPLLQRDIITPSADSVFGKSPAIFPVMAEMAFNRWNMAGASYLTNIDLVFWQKLSHRCYKTQRQKNWNVSIHQVLTIMVQNKNDKLNICFMSLW